MPDVPTSGPVWVHYEPDGIGDVIAAGIKRAKAGALTLGDLRALLVGSMFLFDAFSTTPAKLGDWTTGTEKEPALVITPRGAENFSSEARFSAAVAATQTTWALLHARMLANGGEVGIKPTRLITRSGDAAMTILPEGAVPVLPKEAGAAWVVPAVAIVAGAATLVFIADRTAMIIDRAYARQADAKALMDTQGKVLDVLNGHREAERAAGKELPLTPAEAEVLKALQAQQKAFGERTAKGGPFPSVTEGVMPSGNVTALLVAAVVAAFLLLKG